MHLNNIPIINYHKIQADSDIGLTSRHPERFRRDLSILKEEGYSTITFEDLYSEQPLPSKPIVITFDDGYESLFSTALDIMKEFGFRGVVYLPAAYIGRYNTWDVQFGGKTYRHLSDLQLQALRDHGFEIGSHCMSHQLLLTMDEVTLQYELAESKRILEQKTGADVISVSYPFGRFNRRVLDQAAESGYRFGLASVYYRNPRQHRHLALRRYNIYRHDSDRVFWEKIIGNFAGLTGLRDWLIQKGGLATAIYQNIVKKPGWVPVTVPKKQRASG